MELQKQVELSKKLIPGCNNEEAKAIEAYSDNAKLGTAGDLEIKQHLSVVFALVGLSSYPDKAAEIVLIRFIRSNFSAFSLKEMALAFEMAVAGRFEVDTSHYNQFSPAYFSRVMNAYKVWVTEVRKQYDKPVYKEFKVSVSESEWRKQIQLAYDSYSAKTNFRLWPVEFYDQLTLDGFIELAYYEGLMIKSREMLCAEANKKMIGEDDDLKLKSLTSLIMAYRGKHKEYEVILLAKQLSVKYLFDFGKETGTNKFYERL